MNEATYEMLYQRSFRDYCTVNLLAECSNAFVWGSDVALQQPVGAQITWLNHVSLWPKSSESPEENRVEAQPYLQIPFLVDIYDGSYVPLS